MDTIRNYLDSLFIGVPQSTEIDKLKTDLLANMEDHYHELMGEGKNEQKKKFSIWKLFWTGSGKTIWGGFVQRMFYCLWHL